MFPRKRARVRCSLLAPLAKRLGAALLAFGLAGSVAGAQARQPFTIAHTLRYATGEDIVGLNPHLNQQLVVSYLSQLTMAYLLRYDANNRPIPELATAVPTLANGGISRDGRTITYHLRRDAKWSDGVPFTSDDVRFSAGVVLNPKNNEGTHEGFDKIERIDTPDAATVVFHLRSPHAGYFYNFFSSAGAQPCLLPKHLLGDLPDINNAPYNALPVGIGPFKYVRWSRADSVELVANPSYFRGRPKLDRIVFKIVPDRNTVLTQLTTHEIDLWLPVPAAYYDRVRGLPGVDVIKQPSYAYNHLDLNMTSPAFHDPAVRLALRLALDRATILEKIRHGVGHLQESTLSVAHPFFDASIKRVPFDLTGANRLLDHAGWVRGGDGIRAKNGVRLSFNFASSTGVPDTDQMLELIRGWWQQIGIEFTVHRYPSPLYFAPLQTGGIVYGGKFDISVFAWTSNPLGDQQNLFGCHEAPPTGQNDPRYCSSVADRAMNTLSTSYDPVVEKRASHLVQETIADDVPTIVLDARDDVFAYNRDLKDFHPNQVTAFDDFMNVDI